jgi:hypothetical protein
MVNEIEIKKHSVSIGGTFIEIAKLQMMALS